MEPVERKIIDALRDFARAEIESVKNAPWRDRQEKTSALLAAVNREWWKIHESDKGAYQRDLDRLNKSASWTGPFQQAATSHGLLMPPKFFGGNPLALDESFVASVSLNHAIPTKVEFKTELEDQQNESDCFNAHAQYFQREYGYSRFFLPRSKVLHAYANAIGVPIPPVSDWRKSWRTINNQFALYLEAWPTRSRKSKAARNGADLCENVFVCALNAIVHDVVLRLLRPSRVLLAGKPTWNVWPDPGLTDHGDDLGRSHVRRTSNALICPVHRSDAPSLKYRRTVRVVRTYFLCRPHGPNSDDELLRLGRDVLGAPMPEE